MLRVATFATLAAALLAVAAAQERRAIALIQSPVGSQGYSVSGNVTFVQTRPGEAVLVQGQIFGLKPNSNFGFHIHEKGDISTKGCQSTGGHFNPQKRQHGAPTDKERHVGDLGNVRSDEAGSAQFSMADPVLSLDGDNNVLGRAVVLHESEDDLGKGTGDLEKGSKATGNAGGRLACGVIGIQYPVEPWSSSGSQVALSGLALTLLSALVLL